MKKFRYFICTALILTFSMVFMSACDFGSEYTQFQIEYTSNLEFLVGEDYFDDVKGIATKKDGSTEDVTDKMEVDSSAYNKNQTGTYKIYFEFENTKLSYEVKVVNEITNETLVNQRLQKAIDNTFKRDENGVFSYEASNYSVYADDYFFNEYMIYEDNDGFISVYLKYEIEAIEDPTDVATAAEIWYTGTKTAGIITMKTYGTTTEVEEITDVDLETFNYMVFVMADSFPVSIYAIAIDDVQANVTDCTLTLDEYGYYIYCEDGTTMSWENDLFYEVDGVSYNFPKSDSATIPTVPEVTTAE